MLKITDKSEKKIRGILVNYACHCTTLSGEPNKICGDWAGYAQEFLERDRPGASIPSAYLWTWNCEDVAAR
jgi:hypothetical protein